MFHKGQGSFATKAMRVVKLQLEVILIPNKDKLLVLLQDLQLSIGAKMDLHSSTVVLHNCRIFSDILTA
jgi:hypothetical protein